MAKRQPGFGRKAQLRTKPKLQYFKRQFDENDQVLMHFSAAKFTFSSAYLHKLNTKNVNITY